MEYTCVGVGGWCVGCVVACWFLDVEDKGKRVLYNNSFLIQLLYVQLIFKIWNALGLNSAVLCFLTGRIMWLYCVFEDGLRSLWASRNIMV